MESVDVSVVVLVYNQINFIEDTIESIKKQVFLGSLEVIVADDCSDDGTFQLACSRLEDFLAVNNSYSNPRNIGLAKNFEKAFLKARGRYIAYLEGDDYWTDEFKLQKQFDFLESNHEFSLAFHDFVLVDKNGELLSDENLRKSALRRNRSKKDMMLGCMIHQNSVLFRNVVKSFPSAFFKAPNHDTFFIGYLSRWGNAGYVECAPLCYRVVEGSLWSSLPAYKKHVNGFLTTLILFSIAPFKFYPALCQKLGSKLYQMLRVSIKWR